MKKFAQLKALCAILAFFVIGLWPAPVSAQHGGHGGGGGGFHGGGGGFHGGSVGGFHGGGSYSSYHGGGSYHGGYHGGGYYGGGYHGGYWGGGYHGWHGGYYGWRGGYWGYPGYGYGWGFGFGWPYGWGNPYGYSYSPGWYAPYSYYSPNYCPPGYSCPSNGDDDPPQSNTVPNYQNDSSKPWRPSSSGGAAGRNRAPSEVETSERNSGILSVDHIGATQADYRVVHPNTQRNNAPLRPEVQHAMRALREMPPFAREREIETGRYSRFSAQEKEILRSVTDN